MPLPLRTRKAPAFSALPALSVAAALAALCLASCYGLRPTRGGGEISKSRAEAPRKVDPADIALPDGYRIEAVASGLSYPTGIAFDDTGAVYVVESGYAYGEDWQEPRLFRVGPAGRLTVIAAGDSNGPWTGVTWYGGPDGTDGAFYVSEGGQLEGGRILRITEGGRKEVLFEGLPSFGDHHTNAPVIGSDGMLYFGQGTATNSGVVGLDNHSIGWLARRRGFHDRPCTDIVLAGVNYATPNPFGGGKKDTVETGAFSPFGTRSLPGQVVKGGVPCNGAIMRMPLRGGPPQVVAWGFRNPFSMAFAPAGQLYVLDNGYDERGSRPVWGAADLLWKVREGGWYGWPDFSGAKTLDQEGFKAPRKEAPALLLDRHPARVPAPTAYLPVHSSANGIDFSMDPSFGHVGEAFVALFGDMAPVSGKTLVPVGFRVVRVDVRAGVVRDFAVNRKGPHGPASRLGTGGLERPVSVRFSPGGRSLYLADFGVLRVTDKGLRPVPRTGVLWRIWKEGGA
jgi:glucose/arabinose dehydrogenase